jgi:hypothetical protein
MKGFCNIHGGYNNDSGTCLFCDYQKLELSNCPYCLVETNWGDGGAYLKEIIVKRKCSNHE